MEKRVKFSKFSLWFTVIVTVVLTGLLIHTIHNAPLSNWLTLAIIMVIIEVSTLLFAPRSVKADVDGLTIRRFKPKFIPYSDIESVILCPPTMAEKRLIGSGGYFGYWGWFSEPSIGRYYASYGRASDCFLVTLKNGRKYMLGCEEAPSFVAYVSARLN